MTHHDLSSVLFIHRAQPVSKMGLPGGMRDAAGNHAETAASFHRMSLNGLFGHSNWRRNGPRQCVENSALYETSFTVFRVPGKFSCGTVTVAEGRGCCRIPSLGNTWRFGCPMSPMRESEGEGWCEDESVSSSVSRENSVCNGALHVIRLYGPGDSSWRIGSLRGWR